MTDTDHGSDRPFILLAIGGDPGAPARLPHALPAGSVVVAADSGLDRLDAGIVAVDHVVGDLDSASPAALERAAQRGATIHRHPADKDATDIELAIDLIVRHVVPDTGLTRLLVVGAGGGRLDHLVADLLLLTSPLLRSLHVTAHLGDATVAVVRPGVVRTLTGMPGDQVSLLPLHGRARGVTTGGLRWPLVDADLVAGTTRALSNELTATTATVAIDEGVVAAIAPGTTRAGIEPRDTPYDPSPRAPRGGHR